MFHQRKKWLRSVSKSDRAKKKREIYYISTCNLSEYQKISKGEWSQGFFFRERLDFRGKKFNINQRPVLVLIKKIGPAGPKTSFGPDFLKFTLKQKLKVNKEKIFYLRQ